MLCRAMSKAPRIRRVMVAVLAALFLAQLGACYLYRHFPSV